MKCAIPEIAWHNREPILSVAIQGGAAGRACALAGYQRLASAGADTHVLIWHLKDGGDCIEIAADLARHQKAVNVVRWSPSGEYLATGDDESVIIVWKQKTEVDPPPLLEQHDEQDREIWLQYKMLRGHLEDVYDISWCPFSNFLISGSVDNTAIIWDVHKGKSTTLLADHKGFVQGVAWDPKNQHVATMSSDRVFRLFDIATKKVLGRNSKTTLPVPESHPLHGHVFKLYYDDTLQSYFRRLDYSPDGDLISVPTGLIEKEENGVVNHINVTYIYKRSMMKGPVCVLPCGDSPSLVTSWNPVRFTLRKDGPEPLIKLPTPMRLILAVATRTSVLLYDTQQATPFAFISNIHYTRLTDLAWSVDGHTLIVSSTDGYCSIIKFANGELGEALQDDKKSNSIDVDTKDSNNKENLASINEVAESSDNKSVMKTPKPKTTPKRRKSTTPSAKRSGAAEGEQAPDTKVVVIDEAAMEPWSRDGITDIKNKPEARKVSSEIVIDEPTEDMKMVFEETNCNESEKKKEETEGDAKDCAKPSERAAQKEEDKGDSTKPLPKTPRRVNFITLSSPKSKKK